MMTASEIRQSFLNFFHEKQHTIVPSASLMPQSPGLLFTNAGMNQFVPYFLGVSTPPWSPARATDTQKCIRAGGKHNDLDDVGYDTSHHTFFEMLGNWSFGDYFKKEAIHWAWELVIERWGFPAERLYATVYCPDKSKGDPGEFDQDAWDDWADLFRAKGLDPKVHIVNGNVKDNFWMMGETGPCGPCSELHVDLTPEGDTMGKLVNSDSDKCIEIWNLVFIQYNAESDGSFRDLPACHVDTGMGFERACSIMQCTDGFKDFSHRISNYATDVFRPIFDRLELLSGKRYEDIYPSAGNKKADATNDQLQEAIAFRVIADHVRTLSFSIADGILPGNNGRNYVLRRILRRGVRYGRRLGFTKPFLAELVDTLVATFGDVFPELQERGSVIKEVLLREESSFNETLDRGLELFEAEIADKQQISGDFAFKLYDTFGFPIDLTALLAEERGVYVDRDRFELLMDQQRERARAARKSEIVRALDLKTDAVSKFVGHDGCDSCEAKVLQMDEQGDSLFIITDKTPFYAEMGGQVSDEGILIIGGEECSILAVQQIGNARAHVIDRESAPILHVGDQVILTINGARRRRIESNHTATHLMHRALREIVGTDASQQGSFVSDERLRFDFNSGALTEQQITAIEERVNDWIDADLPVYVTEYAYDDVKGNKAVTQFFGDKYGDVVRVVQVGGEKLALNGVSMEFCGGSHIDRTGNIGLFKIKNEGAIASGVRRIEAVTGDCAYHAIHDLAEAKNEDIRLAMEKIKEANEG
ncbi:MAG: alanine--tRNA ligase, partial [Akkermansia sp.]